METIGSFAFGICFNLTSVVIPDTVTIIGRPASYQSNAPATCASGNIFDDAVQGFHVYYLNGKNGFDTSQWQPLASSPYTYSAESLGCLLSESQVWQLGHGLPADTDLKPDPSGNEANLLMAYALDLEPNEVIGGNLPRATLVDPDALSISCFAPREDIVYTVETSTDLRSWTTDGVNVSESGAGNRQTAAVGRDLIPRFHRLRASMTSNPDLQRGIRRSNPHFFAFRSGPTADSEAIRQNQISNSYYVCA